MQKQFFSFMYLKYVCITCATQFPEIYNLKIHFASFKILIKYFVTRVLKYINFKTATMNGRAALSSSIKPHDK